MMKSLECTTRNSVNFSRKLGRHKFVIVVMSVQKSTKHKYFFLTNSEVVIKSAPICFAEHYYNDNDHKIVDNNNDVKFLRHGPMLVRHEWYTDIGRQAKRQASRRDPGHRCSGEYNYKLIIKFAIYIFTE